MTETEFNKKILEAMGRLWGTSASEPRVGRLLLNATDLLKLVCPLNHREYYEVLSEATVVKRHVCGVTFQLIPDSNIPPGAIGFVWQ